MPDTEKTGDSIVLNPIFHYTRPVEILKRFTEQVTALSEALNAAEEQDTDQLMDLAQYVSANIEHVRGAVSTVMADDIERQIQITKDFPLRQALFLHKFVSGQQDVHCHEDDCYALASAMVHTL